MWAAVTSPLPVRLAAGWPVEFTTTPPLCTSILPLPVPDSAGEAVGLSTQRSQGPVPLIDARAEAETLSVETPMMEAKSVLSDLTGISTRISVGATDASAEMQESLFALSGR